MKKLDDMALVREFAAHNSETAFETLVTRHINLVHTAAMRQVCGDSHLAQEITQAVFIILSRKAASLPDGTLLIGWLLKTTRYTALAELRSAGRRERLEKKAHMESLISETPDEAAWLHIAPLLDEALANLNETDRRAVLLRFFERQTLGEVGAALSLNEEAARKRVNRGVEKLRKFFAKRGVTQTAAAIGVALAANSVQAAPVGLAVTISAATVKGAAVSGSTLTLIKGALKLMAWTKAKISIATAAIVAASAGCSVWTVEKIIVNHDPVGVPGLIGWWKLDDATTVQDSSHIFANNHNGIPLFKPGTAPGKRGRALSFDGRRQYVALGNIFQDSYKQLSIACWVKHPRTSWQIVVERNRPDDTDGISLMMDNMGESVDFGHYPDFVKSTTKVQDNKWHHIVGTMAPSGSEYTYSIYVDGELDISTNLTRGLTATTKAWSIGARHDGTWPYQGLISDVRLYDHALSAAQVRQLYKD